MEIRFTRKNEEQHIIHCVRKDGSATWMQSGDFFVRHDLMHYAVETTLQYKDGFYGMLSNGTNITDFELPKDQRHFQLTEQALHAESIVNLALIAYFQGIEGGFAGQLEEVYRKNEYPAVPPVVTSVQEEQIIANFDNLYRQWQAVQVNETLTLTFDVK